MVDYNKIVAGIGLLCVVASLFIVLTHSQKVNAVYTSIDNSQYTTLNNTIVKTEIVKETTIQEPKFNPEKQCISVHYPNATSYIWECNDITGVK